MDETILPSEGISPTYEDTEDTVEETTENSSSTEKTYTEAQWNEIHGRAKKAEAELKALKSQPQTPNVEETVLLANGMPEELLTQLKKVAAVSGTNLLKAQTDTIFVAIKEKFERDQKHEEASLPASRGAGQVKAQKGFNTPGLTREEHMAMFNKTL